MAKKQKSNAKEICWNLIDCFIAGVLVFFGAFVDGSLTQTEILASFGAAGIVAVTRFAEYWKSEQGEYCPKLFVFLPR